MIFNDHLDLLGINIRYEMSELIKTQNTYSHSVTINGDEMHITRLVLYGQKPFIAKKEMKGRKGNIYETRIGYPVIM